MTKTINYGIHLTTGETMHKTQLTIYTNLEWRAVSNE